MFEPAFVIDASVFVADAQLQEPFHADANLLLETLAAHHCVLHVPAIVLSEIAAALARGAGDPDLAREAVSLYRRWPGVRVASVDEALGDLAAEVAAENRIRGCDAVYVRVSLCRASGSGHARWTASASAHHRPSRRARRRKLLPNGSGHERNWRPIGAGLCYTGAMRENAPEPGFVQAYRLFVAIRILFWFGVGPALVLFELAEQPQPVG